MNQAVTERQGHINSLAGLKAMCMLLLFWWHSSLPRPNADLGARTCEFLFLSSGFLVGYNYYYKDVPATWKESLRYITVKLKRFWPLHFFVMIIMWFKYKADMFSIKTFIKMILNMSLLHAWSMNSKVYFSFNGVSWFLSAYIFCCFLSPALLNLVKRLKKSGYLVVCVFLIRLLMEIIAKEYPGEFFNVNFHTYPLVRALEFFMGMSMVPIYMRLKPWVRLRSSFSVSIIEAAAICISICVAVVFNGHWLRAWFVLIAAVVLFVFSFDKGICSKALVAVTPLRWLSGIQFEFFLLHQAIMKCFRKPFSILFQNLYIANIAMFMAVIVASLLYKRLLEKRCSYLFSRITDDFVKIIQS